MKSPVLNRTWRTLVATGVSARLAFTVVLAGALFSACDIHVPTAPGSLTTITVTPNVTLPINATQQFIAVGRDAEGAVVAISPVWTIEAGGGSINGTGLFTAGTVPGAYTATVKATAGTISGTATVNVIVGPLATITVTPNPDTTAITTTQLFAAVGRDAGGNVLSITPTWAVVAGGGTINSSGLFTAGTVPGSFLNTVTATSGSTTGTATVVVVAGPLATITVTPNPDTLPISGARQFVAVGRDASNNVVTFTPNWTVVAGGGTIDAAGMFTAGTTPGAFANTVQASSGITAGNATVVVTVGPLATITVTPNPDTLAINGSRQFVAVGRDAANNVVVIAPVWSVVNGGGLVNSTGMFTAGTTPGTFTNTVQAAVGAINGTATVVVGLGPLATITVTPNPDTLAINGARQFVAVGRDAGNNVVAITPVWSVVNGGGLVNSTGMFTAGTTPGDFTNTVQAAVGAINGTATVVVELGPLATITVTPNPDTLVINGARQFVAVGRDAGNNVVAITPTWTVVASGGAINGTGMFTAGTLAGSFPNTVQAAVGAINGTATVVVIPGPLTTITVSPNPDTTAITLTQQFTAVGTDAGGNVVPVTPGWNVVAGGGTIDGAGLFTAGTLPGSFINTVEATSGPITGLATVVVLAGPLATITVTPNPDSLDVLLTSQFTAVGRDASNNIVVIAPVWSVVAGGGTIDVNGLFTAGSVGGDFPNTVQATSGAINGNATVVVIDPLLINFGAAAPNGIMAGTQITCIASGTISADILISPGNTVTGFPPCIQTGTQNLANAVAAQAQLDLTAAYDSLFAMPCPPANAIVADLGGTTKPAGVYCTAIGIGSTGVLTLDGGGDPNAKFVFQAGTSIVTAGDVVLINGAQAKNVYWVSGSSVTLGTASQWQGNVVALTSITMVDTATLIGRALARNGAVTLGTGNTITLP
jgi:hypothetical protein